MAKQTKYISNGVSTAKTTRSIINISLPEALAKEVKKEVKNGGFASTSEFFRHVLRERNMAQLAKELKAERDMFTKGGGKRLTSLKDLR